MTPAPGRLVALLLLVVVYAFCVVGAPPRRPISPWWCVAPLLTGGAAFGLAIALLPLAGPSAASAVAVVGLACMVPALWICRAPPPGLDGGGDSDEEDGGGDGGGGGGGGGSAPRASGGPPDGGVIDWGDFERA